MALPVPAEPPVPISVIPWPKSVAVTGRRTPPRGLHVKSGEGGAAAFEQLTEMLFPGEGLVRGADEGGYPVQVSRKDGFAPEAYALELLARPVPTSRRRRRPACSTASSPSARSPAARAASAASPSRPAAASRTRPRWAGAAPISTSRAASTRAEEMAQFLAILAWNKLNVLHWHLSDDEAWRVEIEAYPELVEKAAWRGYGMPIPPLLGSGPERSGGYYTKETVKNLVAVRARHRHRHRPRDRHPGPLLRHARRRCRSFATRARTGSTTRSRAFPTTASTPASMRSTPHSKRSSASSATLFPSQVLPRRGRRGSCGCVGDVACC